MDRLEIEFSHFLVISFCPWIGTFLQRFFTHLLKINEITEFEIIVENLQRRNFVTSSHSFLETFVMTGHTILSLHWNLSSAIFYPCVNN